ncbi:hypothetical protein MRX96_026879 [Rhipicephalus microplus]
MSGERMKNKNREEYGASSQDGGGELVICSRGTKRPGGPLPLRFSFLSAVFSVRRGSCEDARLLTAAQMPGSFSLFFSPRCKSAAGRHALVASRSPV